MQDRKFVLNFIDPATGCIRSQAAFETSDISALCRIIDPGQDNIPLGACYDLDHGDMQRIAARFGVAVANASDEVRLRSWLPIDELPYLVHTNRELALMLNGSKPFAAFTESYPSNPDLDLIPERYFAPYVESGLLLRKEYLFKQRNGRQSRIVLYAKPQEEWRMEAYRLLKQTAEKTGWNEGFERIEGTLLGYEEWQNDIYIETLFKRTKA
ncbi:MAG TPA: hypothetical protein VGC21_03270 [Telluria sp.]|jgi:hypothetical protein